MNQVESLKLVGEFRNNCGSLDLSPIYFFGTTYYIFIHEGLRTATVNKTGDINMSGVEYVITVRACNCKNFGYTYSSLQQLAMVDHDFIPINSINFGNWNFIGLGFTNRPYDWYDQYKPYPHLTLASDPSINNYRPMTDDEMERFPKWEWKCNSIEDFNTLLTDIHEFAAKYPL